MKNLIILAITLGLLLFNIPASADTVILPHRVIDGRTGMVVDFEGLMARCSTADFVTLGEQHDDPATHLIELAVIEGLYRYKPEIVVSLEMFERDVQELVDQYLAGDITEDEFLENSRPWGNYQTDYRPVIEFARNNTLPVIAANVPRPLASRIAMGGGWENAEYTDDELPWMAETFDAPQDEYWEAFLATMNAISEAGAMGSMQMSEEMIMYFYEAQVLKDETMAESVTKAWETYPGSLVYFFAGAFHLQDYLGTFARIERNVPSADTVLILVLPVEDILAGVPDDASDADYYILVQAPPYEEEEMVEMPEMPSMPPMDEGEEAEVDVDESGMDE